MSLPQQLIDGYRAFLGGRLRHEQDRYRELAESGQSPQVMVIGCCDSRVSPEVIFDARPGELFVARNVANLVPPYTPDGAQRARVGGARIRACRRCKVKHIVVLGHAQCGGIRAFAEEAAPLSPGDFIGKWMALIAPAAEAGRAARRHCHADDYLTRLEQASVRQDARQSDDVSAACEYWSSAASSHARRLFRRGDGGRLSRVGQDERDIPAVAADEHARAVRQPAVLGRFLLRLDQLAVDQALRRSAPR